MDESLEEEVRKMEGEGSSLGRQVTAIVIGCGNRGQVTIRKFSLKELQFCYCQCQSSKAIKE
jgi:hypothetical protein